jgi:hypothetical protein
LPEIIISVDRAKLFDPVVKRLHKVEEFRFTDVVFGKEKLAEYLVIERSVLELLWVVEEGQVVGCVVS